MRGVYHKTITKKEDIEQIWSPVTIHSKYDSLLQLIPMTLPPINKPDQHVVEA